MRIRPRLLSLAGAIAAAAVLAASAPAAPAAAAPAAGRRALATATLCSGCAWIQAADTQYTQFNGCDVTGNGGEAPYTMGCTLINVYYDYFRFIDCQNVSGTSWCNFEDSTSHCMNAIDNGSYVVQSGCVSGDTPEQWAQVNYGDGTYSYLNRHFDQYLSVDISNGNTIHDNIAFTWTRPTNPNG